MSKHAFAGSTDLAKSDLSKFHLTPRDDKWRLEPGGDGRAERVFDTKAEATAGGA